MTAHCEHLTLRIPLFIWTILAIFQTILAMFQTILAMFQTNLAMFRTTLGMLGPLWRYS